VLSAHGVAISMDGRGRFSDNIFVERLWRSLKYEEVVCCESFIGDGEWPPEVGLQGQTSNRHKLRG
jgi:transposase InsO family protein